MKKNIGFVVLIFFLFSFYLLANYHSSTYKEQNPVFLNNPVVMKVPPPPVPDDYDYRDPKELVIMGWNVENLFDSYDEPDTDDEEYTPSGRFRWNDRVVRRKIYQLTDILRRVNGGLGPDIIGLCEVENIEVLKRLTDHPNVRKLGYRHGYLKDGKDPRGIDVALVSRYEAERVQWHSTYPGGREILQAMFDIRGRKLHVFVNHWRSRLGGKKQSESRRIEAARKCRSLVQGIVSRDPHADIVLLGDFNDQPKDVSIRNYLQAFPYRGKREAAMLYNVTFDSEPPEGTKPHYFDQIIVSRGMLDSRGFSYIPSSFEIVAFPFMHDSWGKPIPFSSFEGKGYSDHFPVIARFKIR